MFFDFLDDVFLLDLSLEATQSIFNRFTVLNPNFRHSVHPQSGCDRFLIITYFDGYGDVSLMFRAGGEAILSRKRHPDLHSLLRNETGSRNRLPFILPILKDEPFL